MPGSLSMVDVAWELQTANPDMTLQKLFGASKLTEK